MTRERYNYFRGASAKQGAEMLKDGSASGPVEGWALSQWPRANPSVTLQVNVKYIFELMTERTDSHTQSSQEDRKQEREGTDSGFLSLSYGAPSLLLSQTNLLYIDTLFM